MSKKLTNRELLEEIYKNVRYNGDVLENSQSGTQNKLIGDRPPKRP